MSEGKNIVICFDGTWNTLDSVFPATNVVMTAERVLPVTASGQPQIVFYDEGVGSGKVGVASRLDRVLGGAFGLGLMQNIEDAYRFLIFNYVTGDKIFIFGFSRGAFSARSLAGLIRNCGILQRKCADLIGYAVRLYKNRDKENGPDAENSVDFRKINGVPGFEGDTDHNVPVEYIGVWDTVGALGVPRHLFFANYFNKGFQFHDHKLSSSVRSARHALAIDEDRRNFAATPWENINILNQQKGAADLPADERPYLQQWFPGDHSSVGGGGTEFGLAAAALLWILEGAQNRGLEFDNNELAVIRAYIDHTASLNCMGEEQPVGLLSLLTRKSRPGPDAPELSQISSIARKRFAEAADQLPEKKLYRPRPLRPVIGSLIDLLPE